QTLATSATRAHQLIATAASTFSQRVALEVLTDPAVPHRDVYRERRSHLLASLDRAGLEYVPPEGAFYCLVRIPEAVRLAANGTSSSLWTALALLEEAN